MMNTKKLIKMATKSSSQEEKNLISEFKCYYYLTFRRKRFLCSLHSG
ncbi:hypothetical protein AALP_AA1G300800 [Arabis alpina]|uniref:Uncharacterized protein n=1 Tax=Arabis alpina TaxID=50452 RepID=A0A087HRL7_ARAAL|nr:hypothetical protein AALP_AA1G300800 [Arabis alpina]